MRLIEMLRLLALPLLVIALFVRGSERRMVRQLREAGALTPERAVTLQPRRPLGAWVMRRLLRAGVIIPVADRCFLSMDALGEFRRRRKKRAIAIFVGLAALVAVLLWSQAGRPI